MISLNKNFSFFESNHASIKQILFGMYSFGKGYTEIIHPNQSGNVIPELTELHESQHLHICSSTTFGLFQNCIGSFLKDPDLPSHLKQVYSCALTHSINHSWYAHEGVATTVELVAAARMGRKVYREIYVSLPNEYKKAVKPFQAALKLTTLPVFIGYGLSEALAHIAFASQILDDMCEHNNILNAGWESYFSRMDNSPDKRLNILYRKVLSHQLLKELSKKLLSITIEILSVSTPSEILGAFDKLPPNDVMNFNDRIIDETISFIKPKLPFVLATNDTYETMDKFKLFFGACLDYFEKNSISLRYNYRFLDKSQNCDLRAEHSLNISYISKEIPINCINLLHSLNLWDELKKTNNILYTYFLFNFADEKIVMDNEGSMVIEPGGGYIRMQAVTSSDVSFKYFSPIKYFSPMKLGNTDQSLYATAINVPASDILVAFENLGHTKHLLVVDEIIWDALIDKFEEQFLIQTFNKPLFIIIKESTLQHWVSIINLETGKKRVGIFQTKIETIDTKFCVLITEDSNKVYIRPTSSLVFNKIVEKYEGASNLVTQDILTEFGVKEKWIERMEIFIHHYATFGF